MATAEPNTTNFDPLKAQLAALEGKTDDAISALGDKDDPESLFRRLAILTDAERFGEAAAAVRGKPPHERWCEKGTLALAAAGELDEAAKLVEWARGQKDPVPWQGAVVALARGRYLNTLRESGAGKAILPGELSTSLEAGVRASLVDLTPLVTAVRAARTIRNGIEASAICLAMEFTYVLGDREEYRQLAELLWDRKPLPLHYAYAVIRKVIPPDPALPARLRSERGDTFEAKRLAAFIEGTLLDKPDEAIASTKGLLAEYRSAEHVEQLAALLLQLAAKLPTEVRDEITKEAEQLLGGGSRYARLREIEADLKADRYKEAEERLLSAADENDPNWLELLAGVRVGQSREAEAVELLVKASELFPDIGLLRKAAILAEQTAKRSTAIQLAERILRVAPDDIMARGMLARLYTQLGEYEKAAGQYRLLRRQRPDEVAFGLNEAVSLAFALKHEASLRVYHELCTADSPPLAAVVGRAVLLKGMNRAEEGFKSLEPFKAVFHDQPDFLKAYVDLGFSSKREKEAHWGFERLHQLQTQGTIEKVLHEVDITELVGIIRKHAENEETLNRGVLKGQFPWLLAGQMLNVTPTDSLRARTQPLRWLNDEPAAWAKHTVYSTNGYVVTGEVGGQRWIEPIEASQAGTNVVVDLTALMTMQRLGIMDDAAEHFGTCFYPADYLPASLQEQQRLVVHQPSRLEAVRAIKSAIDSGRIRESEPARGLPYIHEHQPESVEDVHSYGLVDLLPGLEAGQLLTDVMSQELQSLSRRVTGVDSEHAPINIQDEVRIDYSTLETLAQHGLLKAVLSSYRVLVSPDDRKRIEGELSGWEERQLLWKRQSELWEAIRRDSRFVAVGVTIPDEFMRADAARAESDRDEPEPARAWMPLHSVFLAEEKGLPLLVDDRCCQMLTHNTRRSSTVTFGCDSLLAALLETGRLAADQAAEAYLRLIGWRYRFMVLPVSVLLALAKQSLRNAPGQHLRKVSRYVQECMRDPGLFCGPEPTNPPVGMAHKLFLSWTNNLANFVVSCWVESDVSEESAEALTFWALTECLPAPPFGVGPQGRVLAEVQPRVVLTQALIRSGSLSDTERVNKALLSIVSVLGISDREYINQVAEVVDALRA